MNEYTPLLIHIYSKIHAVQYTLYTVHFTMYTVHFTVYSV